MVKDWNLDLSHPDDDPVPSLPHFVAYVVGALPLLSSHLTHVKLRFVDKRSRIGSRYESNHVVVVATKPLSHKDTLSPCPPIGWNNDARTHVRWRGLQMRVSQPQCWFCVSLAFRPHPFWHAGEGVHSDQQRTRVNNSELDESEQVVR